MLFVFVLIVLQHMAMSKIQTYCPQTKKVGDTCYTLVKMTLTQNYGCMQDCIYRKTVEPEDGNLYCFKAGPLPVTDCEATTTNPPNEILEATTTNPPNEILGCCSEVNVAGAGNKTYYGKYSTQDDDFGFNGRPLYFHENSGNVTYCIFYQQDKWNVGYCNETIKYEVTDTLSYSNSSATCSDHARTWTNDVTVNCTQCCTPSVNYSINEAYEGDYKFWKIANGKPAYNFTENSEWCLFYNGIWQVGHCSRVGKIDSNVGWMYINSTSYCPDNLGQWKGWDGTSVDKNAGTVVCETGSQGTSLITSNTAPPITGRITVIYEQSKFYNDTVPEPFEPNMWTTMCNSSKLCVTDNTLSLYLVAVYEDDVEPHTNDEDKCTDVNYNIMTTGEGQLSSLFKGVNITVLHETDSSCPKGYYMVQMLVDSQPCKCVKSTNNPKLCRQNGNRLGNNYCTGWSINGYRKECTKKYCNFVLCKQCYKGSQTEETDTPV